jgi:hypothetical protein
MWFDVGPTGRTKRMRRPSLTSLTLLAVLWTTPVAYAQVDAQIAELNGQALEAYQALDIDTARGKLEQAIGLAQQSGVGGPVVAQSYMSLGVVYVAGMNDRDQGLTAFVSAVCMQPDVQLDPLLSTPDVQQVFVQAQQDAQGGACGPGAAMAPPVQGGMPQQGYPSPADAAASGYGGPRSDVECPPGVICDAAGAGEAKGPSNFARGFFNLQLAVGSSLVGQGMKADSKPKNWMSEVYQPAMLVPFDSNGDGMIDDKDTPVTRYLFDDASAWVPDADSFDDYPKDGGVDVRGRSPLSTKCAADGKASGPPDIKGKNGMLYATREPSSYCVRVEKTGFVTGMALRLNPGYFVSKRFALSVPVRIAFNAGKGSMANLLIGLRGEVLFSPMDKATGVPISWFFGATYGQIQAKPPPKDPKRPAPYVMSGPLGLHTGVNVRIRVHRNFGFIVAPEVDVMLPNILLNFDVSGGVEAAF